MSEIYININKIRSANYNIPAVVGKVAHANRSVWKMKRQIADEIMDQRRIRQRLDKICGEIESLERHINELYVITKSCMMQYEAAENENSHNAGLFL